MNTSLLKRVSFLIWGGVGAIATLIGISLDIPEFIKSFQSEGNLQVSIWGDTKEGDGFITSPFLIGNNKIQFVHIPLPIEEDQTFSICSQMHYVLSTMDLKTLKDARITFDIIKQKNGEGIIYETVYGDYYNNPELACSFGDNIIVSQTFSGKEQLKRSLRYKDNPRYNIAEVTYYFSDVMPNKYGVINFFQHAIPGVLLLTEKDGESIFQSNETISSPPESFYLNVRPVYVSVTKTLDDGSDEKLGQFLFFYHLAKTRADLLLNSRIISENYTYRMYDSIDDVWTKTHIEHIYFNGGGMIVDYEGLHRIGENNNSDVSALISELKKSDISGATMIQNKDVALHCEKVSLTDRVKYYFSDKLGDFSNLDVFIDSKNYIEERNQLRAELALMNTFPSMFADKAKEELLVTKYQNDCSIEEVNISVEDIQ